MPEKQIQPLPWHAEPENETPGGPDFWCVRDVNDTLIFDGVTKDEAEFIVRSCNHRHTTLNALRHIQSQCAGHSDEFSRRVWQAAQAVLAVVE